MSNFQLKLDEKGNDWKFLCGRHFVSLKVLKNESGHPGDLFVWKMECGLKYKWNKSKIELSKVLILMYEGMEKGENKFEKMMLVNLRFKKKKLNLKVEGRSIWKWEIC